MCVCVCVCVCVCIYPTLLLNAVYDAKFFFLKRSTIAFNSESFFFKIACPTSAKKPSLSYYLPMSEGN